MSDPVADLPPNADSLRATLGDVTVRLASDMVLDPGIMERPRPIVPWLAYHGRLTEVAGPKKAAGKSTAVATAIAQAQTGKLFGARVVAPIVLWVCCDEPVGDLLRRLRAADAELTRIYIITSPATLAQIIAAARLLGVDLVVIDTIGDLMAGLADEDKNSEVKAYLAPLRTMAREHGIAGVYLHHTTKSTGMSRGASAFSEVVDMTWTISTGKDDPTLRHVEVQGRLAVESFDYRWTGTDLEIPNRPPTTLETVRSYIAAHPGCRSSNVYGDVKQNRDGVREAIAKLSAAGHIVNRGNGQAKAWFFVEPSEDAGRRSTDPENPAPVMPGNGLGNDPVTPFVTGPLKERGRVTIGNGAFAELDDNAFERLAIEQEML